MKSVDKKAVMILAIQVTQIRTATQQQRLVTPDAAIAAKIQEAEAAMHEANYHLAVALGMISEHIRTNGEQ